MTLEEHRGDASRNLNSPRNSLGKLVTIDGGEDGRGVGRPDIQRSVQA